MLRLYFLMKFPTTINTGMYHVQKKYDILTLYISDSKKRGNVKWLKWKIVKI